VGGRFGECRPAVEIEKEGSTEISGLDACHRKEEKEAYDEGLLGRSSESQRMSIPDDEIGVVSRTKS
jgi:hypothetical protein